MSPLTWAVLSAYARTGEGVQLAGLCAHLHVHAPAERMRNTARLTAIGLGCLTAAGELTPAGTRAALNALARMNLIRGKS